MSPPPAKKIKTGENSSGVGVGVGVGVGGSHNSMRRLVLVQTAQRGFLATCNFQINSCIREAYNILSHYGAFVNGSVSEVPATSDSSALQQLQADDISDELLRIINAAQQQSLQPGKERYMALETGAQNTVFIRSSISDPVKLGSFIVRDIFNTKCQRTRALMRLIPIEVVCSAGSIEAIVKAVAPILDKHFVNKPCTYSIVVNRRLNNSIERSDVIRQLAGLVRKRNANNKVDLSTPEKSVVVEIIKGSCMIGVLPYYFKYKKYNLIECARSDNAGPVYPVIAPNAGIMVPEAEDSPVDCVPDEAAEEPMVGPIDEPDDNEDEAKPVYRKMTYEELMRSDDEEEATTAAKQEEDEQADSDASTTKTNEEPEVKSKEEAVDSDAAAKANSDESDDCEEEEDEEENDDDEEEEEENDDDEEEADSDAKPSANSKDNGEKEEEENEADSTTIPIETSNNDAKADDGEQATEGKKDNDDDADETLAE